MSKENKKRDWTMATVVWGGWRSGGEAKQELKDREQERMEEKRSMMAVPRRGTVPFPRARTTAGCSFLIPWKHTDWNTLCYFQGVSSLFHTR